MTARPSLLLATGALLLAGCLAPKLVGVEPVGLDQARKEIGASALDGEQLSDVTREVFTLYDLQDLFEREPRAALREVHRQALREPHLAVLFALAESSYLLGKRERDPQAFLAAAVYAYLFLLGDETSEVPNPYDRRFRWAADLYNQGLLRAGLDEDGERFAFAAGERELPVGRVHLCLDVTALQLDPPPYAFLPTDRFRIHGLKLRLRDSGLGVPLIGLRRRPEEAQPGLVRSANNEIPVTAFLRLAGGLADMERGLQATLEFHSGYDSEELEIGGRKVPLESDRSTVLAHALDSPTLWRFSLTGLFAGERAVRENCLILAQPYTPGRVPVVFVHGTASSPAYWADLFNTLWWDPELRHGTQFWFFQYASGNPIAYSAADLREALNTAVERMDPEGKDPALREMVIVGHSQGGLLARMMVVKGELTWLEELTGQPLASLGLDPPSLALLTRCLEFEPLPFVKRVVFVSTPHRGSFLSQRWFSSLLSGLISLPTEVANAGRRLWSDEARLPKELRGRRPTSLDNMDPDSPFLKRLARAPLALGVHAHSIISIGDADPHDPAAVAAADDGVVEYSSAHVAEAESEDLVPCGHSCQSHPATIQAVRRILRAHIGVQP